MNLRSSYNILNRIASGYYIIISVILGASIFSITVLNSNNDNTSLIFDNNVFINTLKDFSECISKTEKLSHSWIYQSNKEEKELLKQNHDKVFPEVKAKIYEQMKKVCSKQEQDSLHNTLAGFEKVIELQRSMMGKLVTEEDYNDDVKIDESITLYEKHIKPNSDKLVVLMNDFIESFKQELEQTIVRQKESNKLLAKILIGMMVLIILISIIIRYLTARIITAPLLKLKEHVLNLAKGEVSESEVLKKRDSFLDGYKSDEIGQMTKSVEFLIDGIISKTEFANQIGQGNYNVELNLLGENDTMGIALKEMRDRLKTNQEEDRKRIWATEGYAKFGDILRSTNDNMKELSENIICNLVKYLKANQGSIFLLNDSDNHRVFMELMACYAWDRKKFVNKEISMGEGLVGQTWQEGETIFLTEIPNNYVQITSGLGGANPSSLMIVPLKVNDQIHGIIEVASFNVFERFQIEFVEKLGESIASTISTVKVNIKTKELLIQSQSQAEELQAQEEEMRQNIEEMHATQEEMIRKESVLNNILDAVNYSTGTIEFDLNGIVLSANAKYLKMTNVALNELKGKPITFFMADEVAKSEEFNKIWKTINNGLVHSGRHQYFFDDKEQWFSETFSPVKDFDGVIYKVLCLSTDVTDNVLQYKKSKEQAEILAAKEEELKKNLEELKLTQVKVKSKNIELEEFRESMIEESKAQAEMLQQRIKELEEELKNKS